ncbi:MAG: glycosyl transferase family 2 [Candidatus Nanohaloarchaea archaeon]|nr:glycosyl transferase family 2 [Candidatus Nanohaloarchaea archaeon]
MSERGKVGSTALRKDGRDRLEEIEEADILIGIPTFDNDQTVDYVVEKTTKGVKEHFPDKKAVVMVSDGGSLDDTREKALEAEVPEEVDRIVTIYRGIPGKGSAFRAVFEAADLLDVDACVVLDGDLRSRLDEWVERHLTPVFEEGMDFLTPNYIRHKHDATITNNVCFPLTASLYGRKVRQPIGGDFALSGRLARYYAEQDVWDTDVARFGIDIWMTTTAICGDFDVGQTNLGVKLHDSKDPGESLGPMFRQVVGTLFRLMDKHSEDWRDIMEIEDAPIYGDNMENEVDHVEVDLYGLKEKALEGWDHHEQRRSHYKRYLSSGVYHRLKNCLDKAGVEELEPIPADLWVKVLFDYAVAYNFSGDDRKEVLDSLVPLYFARSASLFEEMEDMGHEEAERHIRKLPELYQAEKGHLIERWDRNGN